MSKGPPAVSLRSSDVQHAQIALQIGERSSLTMEVTVTSTGVLAIGALVSAILLSSAVIVRAARR